MNEETSKIKVVEIIENYEDEIDLEAAQKALEDHIVSGAKSIPIDEFFERYRGPDV